MSKRPATAADIIGVSSDNEFVPFSSSAAGLAGAAAAATTAASSSATKPSSSQEIISLLDDDDFCNSDNESDAIDRAMRASLGDASGGGTLNGRAAKRQRRPFRASPRGVVDSMSSGDGGVISLLSDSDDDGGGKAGPSDTTDISFSTAAAGRGVKREAKRERAALRGGPGMNVGASDDEVTEVAPTEPVLERFETVAASAAFARKSGDDDDEIEAIGTSNVLRLPHARHDCTQHSFVEDVSEYICVYIYTYCIV